MNSVQIKNWLIHIKKSIEDGMPIFDIKDEKSSKLAFIQELELFIINIEELNSQVLALEQKMEKIEHSIGGEPIIKKKIKKSGTLDGEYIQSILVKISILKNIIKNEIGDDISLMSPHLIVVESIENEIKTTKRVSKDQLEQLNVVYNQQRIAGKI